MKKHRVELPEFEAYPAEVIYVGEHNGQLTVGISGLNFDLLTMDDVKIIYEKMLDIKKGLCDDNQRN